MQPGETIRSGLAEIELRAPVKSITEVELEARAKGLSYGKYLAGYRLDRELEEAAARRQAELRAMEEQRVAAFRRRKAASSPTARRVVQITDDGEIIKVFGSMRQAAKAAGVTEGSISISCRNYRRAQNGEISLGRSRKGFRWRYAED